MKPSLSRYVDSHIHLNEYSEVERLNYCGREDLELIAVSEDLKSSLTNLTLMRECRNVRAAVGMHPWLVDKVSGEDFSEILRLINEVEFIGEVGLDKRFVPDTLESQMRVFTEFVRKAEESGKGLLLHAAGAWREVLDVVTKASVSVAVMHWYTGPTELITKIREHGYYIGVNAALIRQPKAREVVRQTPLDTILTESDGPYEYRGLRLGPDLIQILVKEIAVIKGLRPEEVVDEVYNNYLELIRRVK
ncbi:MAG: TatD family hydrolase [Zestosphaera sp.]